MGDQTGKCEVGFSGSLFSKCCSIAESIESMSLRKINVILKYIFYSSTNTVHCFFITNTTNYVIIFYACM